MLIRKSVLEVKELENYFQKVQAWFWLRNMNFVLNLINKIRSVCELQLNLLQLYWLNFEKHIYLILNQQSEKLI